MKEKSNTLQYMCYDIASSLPQLHISWKFILKLNKDRLDDKSRPVNMKWIQLIMKSQMKAKT